MTNHGCLLPTRGAALSSTSAQELTDRVQSDVLELARMAEDRGFDSVWVGDRVVDKHRPEALSTLAAVAGETEAIDLGTAVYLPTLRNPIHVAHQTATLQHLSGGRLSLGVGVGGPDIEYEHERLGIPYEGRGSRLDETLDIVRALWSGEAVTYDGEHHAIRDVQIGIQPPTEPHIYVATTAYRPDEGFPSAIRRRIATHGGGWLPLGMAPETYDQALDTIREVLDDANRDPGEFDPAFYQDVVIADTEQKALDRARKFLLTYYEGRWDTLSDDDLRARGAFGPPEVVADHLKQYTDAGVETFVTRFATADQHEQVAKYAELLD